MRPNNPQQAPPQQTQIFQISQTSIDNTGRLVIKIRLAQTVFRPRDISSQINQIVSQMFKKLKNFQDRGKYPQLKFSYVAEHKFLCVFIDKNFYLNVLNFKKYQVLVFSRVYITILDDYWSYISQILNSRLIKEHKAKILSVDIFSLVILKQIQTLNHKGKIEFKRLFVKMSPLQFRRNPYIRSKQSQQYFSVILRNYDGVEEDTSQANIQIPTNQQFYKSPRIGFIDDVFSNQSFAKRLIPRFYTFYMAHNLISGLHPIEKQNRYIKQYYQKCASRVVMNAMRLKKMSFHFKFPPFEKEKGCRISMYLYCSEDQVVNSSTNSEPLPFSIQIHNDSLEPAQKSNSTNTNNQNILQQMFFKHLSESISSSGKVNQGQKYTMDSPFVQFSTANVNNVNVRTIKFMNQVGFARLFCQLCFYMDRYLFKNIGSKTIQQTQNSTNLKDQIMFYKLPFSQQFKYSKYFYNYCVQVKSSYYYSNQTNVTDEQKGGHQFLNTMNKIYMIRKRVKDTSNSLSQNLQFLSTLQQIKGLTVYVNQLLRKWNASDCYHDINNFVSGYLNIIVDKNKQQKQKNLFKSQGSWKALIDALSALTQSLTRTFSTPDTTVLIHILNTYKQKPIQQYAKNEAVQSQQQIMTMTFKVMKLTSIGWYNIIPSCVYYFQMFKDQTYLYSPGFQRQQISFKSKKENIQKTLRFYLQKTLKIRIQLPPIHYQKQKQGQKNN